MAVSIAVDCKHCDEELSQPGRDREVHQAEGLDDAALIDAANAGDASAFEALYHRYRDWVVSTAMRITRNKDDALDVLQETFCYFFKKFPGFELRAKMTTFLYTVTRNLALERVRKRGKSGAPLSEAAEPVAEDAPRPEDGEALAAALARLTESEREIIALRYTDDMKLSEIAEALGMPLGTVKSRLHGALERLREVLGRA